MEEIVDWDEEFEEAMDAMADEYSVYDDYDSTADYFDE